MAITTLKYTPQQVKKRKRDKGGDRLFERFSTLPNRLVQTENSSKLVHNQTVIKIMNAYLIDPVARTISIVETDFSLQSIYSLLECSLITSAAGQPNGDMMFARDNVSDDGHEAFRFGSWEIYSKALVVGRDSSGETISPKTPMQTYKTQVHWLGAKAFEPNVAVMPFPDSAIDDRMATAERENLDWWDDFFKRNGIE